MCEQYIIFLFAHHASDLFRSSSSLQCLVAVMIDAVEHRVTCTTRSKAEEASSIAHDIKEEKRARYHCFPLLAPLHFFNESGWHRYKESSFYFHKERDYYRNGHATKRSRQNYGDKKGNINLPSSGSYKFVDALYETFHGPIPDGYHVCKLQDDGPNMLANLQCVKMECAFCSKPINCWMGRMYCSDLCKQRSNPGQLKCRIDIRRFLQDRVKNYACTIEDAMAVAESRTCAGCGLTNLNLSSSEQYDPRRLSIDCIDRADDESRYDAHRAGNIQCLCLLCNLMKHEAKNSTYRASIAYLRGEADLDLTRDEFCRVGTQVCAGKTSTPGTQFTGSFSRHGIKTDHWVVAKRLYDHQHGRDAIFHTFPILFGLIDDRPKHCNIFAGSVDGIISGDDAAGIQLLPWFMNAAKSTLTVDELREEFRVRNWLQSDHNRQVLIPPDYYETCYIYRNLGVSGHARRKLATGHVGMKRSRETREKMSALKRGRPNVNGRRHMVLVAIPKLAYGPPNKYDSIPDAVEKLGLTKYAGSNIATCVKHPDKTPSAYGYVWEDWSRDVTSV